MDRLFVPWAAMETIQMWMLDQREFLPEDKLLNPIYLFRWNFARSLSTILEDKQFIIFSKLYWTSTLKCASVLVHVHTIFIEAISVQ